MSGLFRRDYVYALGYRWCNWLYDPLIRLTLRDHRFKDALIAQATIRSEQRVLDVGCGTGTLMLLIRARHPDVRVVGIDGDRTILEIASRKGQQIRQDLLLAVATADRLPFRSGSFDRVMTTLMLHHLDREAKQAALEESHRVLRPGGELYIADWGRPHTLLMRAASLLVSSFDGREVTRDNLAGRIPEFCLAADFETADEIARQATMFGTLSVYRARKAAGPHQLHGIGLPTCEPRGV